MSLARRWVWELCLCTRHANGVYSEKITVICCKLRANYCPILPTLVLTSPYFLQTYQLGFKSNNAFCFYIAHRASWHWFTDTLAAFRHVLRHIFRHDIIIEGEKKTSFTSHVRFCRLFALTKNACITERVVTLSKTAYSWLEEMTGTNSLQQHATTKSSSWSAAVCGNLSVWFTLRSWKPQATCARNGSRWCRVTAS